MLKEFKEFINRGNVMDLAVAVIIAIQFGAVVTAFTDYLLMPLIGMIFGEPDLSFLDFTVNGSTIGIGSFLSVVLNFLIIAFGVFLAVKAVNRFRKPAAAPTGPTEVELLIQIRDSLGGRPI
jgi:large conductance mechanosensitive channel